MSDARKEPAKGRAGDDSKQIYSHQSYSKEQLQDELTNLMFQATEENLGTERLDALLDALNEVDPLPEADSFGTKKSLERFHEKYDPVFSAMETKSAEMSGSSPAKKHSSRALIKILPIAAALIFLFGSVTAQAFGLDIFGAIARWTSEVFQLSDSSTPHAAIGTNPLAEGEGVYYDSLEEAVDAFGITAPIAPKWIPERFKLVKVSAVNKSGGVLIYADYESNDGFLQVRYKEVKNIDFSSLEQEGSGVETRFKNGLEHYLLSDMDREKAFWQNGELECQIAGNVTRQEMKEIVDSIYEGE